MTREEAINLLADMDSDKYTAREAVALTMAIKALESLEKIEKDVHNAIDNALMYGYGDNYINACENILHIIQKQGMFEPEKCGDCISRSEVLSTYADWYGYGYDNGFYRLVQQMKSVDLERKTGKWIDISSDGDMGEFYCCSLCKREIILYPGETLKDYPYCHCGAKMEGGVNCNAED